MTDVNGAIADIQKNFGLLWLCVQCFSLLHSIFYILLTLKNPFQTNSLNKKKINKKQKEKHKNALCSLIACDLARSMCL